MRIYDITQELFTCAVFPGDPAPERQVLAVIGEDTPYNLTAFSMCAHNGTHVDAPSHFFKDGDTVDMIGLEKTLGFAYVCSKTGELYECDALEIIEKAKNCSAESSRRILIKGNAVITKSAAEVFSKNGVLLVGVTSQSVGPIDAPMEVHMILLESKTVLLEGLCLDNVADGVYFLCAQPINLGGCDGAPVRAVLIDFGE